jgi:hypothetical protein
MRLEDQIAKFVVDFQPDYIPDLFSCFGIRYENLFLLRFFVPAPPGDMNRHSFGLPHDLYDDAVVTQAGTVPGSGPIGYIAWDYIHTQYCNVKKEQ